MVQTIVLHNILGMEHTVLTIHPIQVMTDSKTATIITILQVYHPIKLGPISGIFTSVRTDKLQSINCGKRFPNGWIYHRHRPLFTGKKSYS